MMAAPTKALPDPFSAADAASSDSDSDEDAGPRLPPGGRPFTPSSPLPPRPAPPSPLKPSSVSSSPSLHRHPSHVRLPVPLPALPPRGEASADLFGPLVASVGVISDVQHAAGIPDGQSFHGVPRFYAAALEGARRAGEAFARDEAGVRVVIHLGDTVDGQHALRGEGPSEDALRNVVEALLGGAGEEEGEGEDDDDDERPRRRRPTTRTLLNLTSNHDLYNFGGADRARLNALLGIRPPRGKEHQGASYYSFPLAPGWRAIGLDSYDESLLGRAPGDPRHERAAATLRARNPNGSDAKPSGWDSPEGLKGVARRFVRFGGGASSAQVDWLRAELADARAKGERALVLSHLPLHPATAPPACLLWNYDEVVAALEEFPGTVAAVLAGHAHMNGYFFAPHGTGAADWDDRAAAAAGEAGEAAAAAAAGASGAGGPVGAAGLQGGGGGGGGIGRGVHHLVLPCVLETPPDRDCWAVLDIHERGLLMRGVDTCMSLAMATGRGGGQPPGGAGVEETAAAGAAAAAETADALARVAI